MFSRYTRYHSKVIKHHLQQKPPQLSTTATKRTIQSTKPKNQQQTQQRPSTTATTTRYLLNLYNNKNPKDEVTSTTVTGADEEASPFNPLFNEAMSDLFSRSQHTDIIQEQINLEQKSIQDTAMRYHKLASGATQRNQGASLPPARKVLMEWFHPLTEAIKQKQKLFHQMKGDSGEELYEDSPNSELGVNNSSSSNNSNNNNTIFNTMSNSSSSSSSSNNVNMSHIISSLAEETQSLKSVGPCISLLAADELAVITIHSVLSSCLSGGRVLLSNTAVSIGRSVNAQVNIMKLRRAKLSHVLSYLPRNSQYIHNVNHMASIKLPGENSDWDKMTHIQVGGFLIDLLLSVAKVPVKSNTTDALADAASNIESMTIDSALDAILLDIENDKSSSDSKKEMKMEPAFRHELEFHNNKKYGVIVPNDTLTHIINDAHTFRETVDPTLLPMIVQPKPWVGFKDGGYLSVDSLVMRTHGSKFQSLVLQDAVMQDIFEGLNVLNETEWSIHKEVYEVILKAWESGGGIAALPRRQDDVLPEKPAGLDFDAQTLDEASLAELRRWKRHTDKIRQTNRDLHSLRCDMLYKLQVARDFQDRSFYFPHNIDFRGRAYPIPPHLNHLGSDINRGLLLFTRSRRIGERGIFWLKVHLANLIGKDKFSFDERIKFVDDNIDNIMKSADNPLPGLEDEVVDIFTSMSSTKTNKTSIQKLRTEECWWLESENPWQTLAACIELTKCLRSPNPADYECSLPIQMDGSCNGLQHYAALGRDNLGALHVNLLPTEKPMDVYLGVLDVVKKHIDKDASSGHELAKLLQGHVYRNTIKQTVMTSVYGVTFVGAREQITKRLKEKKEIPEDKIYGCGIYLASVTLRSLGEVFQSARGIMDWLNELAHIVASSNHPVIWMTPLGLPVVQPYRSGRKSSVKTVLQNVSLTSFGDEQPVSQSRQKSAFPPNYVHSLDASHMFMTARECKRRGIDFASVHDSFWTHAGDVDTMNTVIREQFIHLHSQPLLETLLESLQKLHPDLQFPPIPKKGTLKLERVLKSPYFFD